MIPSNPLIRILVISDVVPCKIYTGMMKSLGDLKGNLGLRKNHENLTKNGMNPILNSLYNPYRNTLFSIPSF